MNIISKIKFVSFLLFGFALSLSLTLNPITVVAQDSGTDTSFKWDGSLNISRSSSGDIPSLISRTILWLLGILALVATIIIIYAGILLVFNGGNEKRVAQAKSTLLWAIIGLVVAIGSFALVNIIQQVIG